MNNVILIGRLTSDPVITYSGDKQLARYTLAVDRVGEGTDFPNIVAFGHNAGFAEKYLSKGMKIAIEGRITTGSYTNKDGQKVYTTNVVAEHQEFVEPKRNGSDQGTVPESEEFMNIPDGIAEELPFE